MQEAYYVLRSACIEPWLWFDPATETETSDLIRRQVRPRPVPCFLLEVESNHAPFEIQNLRIILAALCTFSSFTKNIVSQIESLALLCSTMALCRTRCYAHCS